MDALTPAQRSKNMSAIRGKDTKPELLVRSYLHSRGVRYRKNVKSLPGKPDIAIEKYKIALEVRGCFWHGHKNCKNFRLPKSNQAFWAEKIGGTIERDRRNQKSLEELGFKIFVVWECQIERADWSVVDDFVKCYAARKSTAYE